MYICIHIVSFYCLHCVFTFVALFSDYTTCTNSAQGSAVTGSSNSVHQFQVPQSPSMNHQQVLSLENGQLFTLPFLRRSFHYNSIAIFSIEVIYLNTFVLDCHYCREPLSTAEHPCWYKQHVGLVPTSTRRN